MKTKLVPLILIIVLCIAICAGCNKDNTIPEVNYNVDNSYDVQVEDNSEYLSFSPKGATAKYGLLFYVGTLIPPSSYEYLGNALAKQGYVMVIPKADLMFAYFRYQTEEIVFERFSNIEFFIGGHSQGGGAAIRRAAENTDITKGVVLLAPLANSHYEFDEFDNESYVVDTIKDTTIPTLLIEASEDHILSDAQKEDAKTRLPIGYSNSIIQGGCHMCFSNEKPTLTDGPFVNMTKEEQHNQTISIVLEFMNKIVRQ